MTAHHETLCPICEAGQLEVMSVENEVTYKEHARRLPLLISVCQACGSEQASAQQLRDNKRVMMAFRKEVDGLLTGAELRALRERLGISQAQAARLFGGGPVAFSKYENDDVAQSDAMDRLIRLAAEVPEALHWLAQRAGEPQVSASAQRFRSYLVSMARQASTTTRLGKSFNVSLRRVDEHQVITLESLSAMRDADNGSEVVLL